MANTVATGGPAPQNQTDNNNKDGNTDTHSENGQNPTGQTREKPETATTGAEMTLRAEFQGIDTKLFDIGKALREDLLPIFWSGLGGSDIFNIISFDGRKIMTRLQDFPTTREECEEFFDMTMDPPRKKFLVRFRVKSTQSLYWYKRGSRLETLRAKRIWVGTHCFNSLTLRKAGAIVGIHPTIVNRQGFASQTLGKLKTVWQGWTDKPVENGETAPHFDIRPGKLWENYDNKKFDCPCLDIWCGQEDIDTIQKIFQEFICTAEQPEFGNFVPLGRDTGITPQIRAAIITQQNKMISEYTAIKVLGLHPNMLTSKMIDSADTLYQKITDIMAATDITEDPCKLFLRIEPGLMAVKDGSHFFMVKKTHKQQGIDWIDDRLQFTVRCTRVHQQHGEAYDKPPRRADHGRPDFAKHAEQLAGQNIDAETAQASRSALPRRWRLPRMVFTAPDQQTQTGRSNKQYSRYGQRRRDDSDDESEKSQQTAKASNSANNSANSSLRTTDSDLRTQITAAVTEAVREININAEKKQEAMEKRFQEQLKQLQLEHAKQLAEMERKALESKLAHEQKMRDQEAAAAMDRQFLRDLMATLQPQHPPMYPPHWTPMRQDIYGPPHSHQQPPPYAYQQQQQPYQRTETPINQSINHSMASFGQSPIQGNFSPNPSEQEIQFYDASQPPHQHPHPHGPPNIHRQGYAPGFTQGPSPHGTPNHAQSPQQSQSQSNMSEDLSDFLDNHRAQQPQQPTVTPPTQNPAPTSDTDAGHRGV